MDKIKLLFIICVGIIFIQLGSAQPPFLTVDFDVGLTPVVPAYDSIDRDLDFNIVVHVLNSSNGVLITNSTANCTAHLFNPSGLELLEEDMPFNVVGNDFEFTIKQENFTVVGEYNSLVRCFDDERGGASESFFMVTSSGTILSEGEGVVYSTFSVILFIVLALLIWAAIQIPWTNTRMNEDTGQMFIANNKRVYKIGALTLSYLVTMWLAGLLHNISDNYLILTGIANFFKWVYLILLSLAFPVVIVGIILGIIAAIKAVKLEKLADQLQT